MAEPPLKARAATDAALRRDGTGLPPGVAAGVEALSGVAMDAVQLHRDSPEPVALRAPAGTAGADQDRHPHGDWHVVEQKQGREKPSRQRKGGAAVEDDAALEREADRMGAKAVNLHSVSTSAPGNGK